MKDFDPFTGARLTSQEAKAGEPRLGAPPDKFALKGVPVLTEDSRQAVILMLFPPEELRDAPLDVIERVVAAGGAGMLKAISLEIYKSFTSDPLDAAGARNVADALQAHVSALSRRSK